MTERGGARGAPEIRVTLAQILRFVGHVALVSVLVAVPAAVATYLLTNRTAPVYQAVAVILAPLRDLAVDLPGAAPQAADPLGSQVYATALRSDDLLRDALARMAAPDTEGAAATLADAVSLHADDERASNLLRITARASSGALAIDRANAVTQALVAWDDARARADAALLVRTLEEQLAAYERQVAELRALGSRTALAELPNVLLLASDRRQQLAVARSAAVAARGKLEVLQPATRASQVHPNPLVDAFVVAVLSTGLVLVTLLTAAGMDRRVRTAEELEVATGVPLLADFAASQPVAGLPTRARSARMGSEAANARGVAALPFLATRLRRELRGGGRLLVVGVGADDIAHSVATALAEAFEGGTPRIRVGTASGVLASAAALSVATEADAVLMVADPARTDRAAAHLAARMLAASGTPVVGVVAARQRRRRGADARGRLRYDGA